jgi:phosphate:Na+ symporter
MPGMNLLGGLGLFFIGIKALSSELAAMSGLRLRTIVERGSRTPLRAAILGLALGLMTQSSNAVTFIAASLRSAGALPSDRALPLVAWSSVGTSALVLLTTFDLMAVALWLLGVVGCMRYFGLDGGGRWRSLLGCCAGLGLLLLGLALLKLGAAPLRDIGLVRDIMAFAGDARLPVFLAGAAITLVAQSSSAVSILAITLQGAGLLTFDQAVLSVYGASLGSGAAVWLMAAGLSGTARQPVIFQALLKAAGSLLFAALLLVEETTGWPLVLALSGLASHESDTRLAVLFLLLQAVPALIVTPVQRPLGRLLERMLPATRAEDQARPVHLYPAAVEDAASALTLVAAEQDRLLQRLPAMLDTLRVEATDKHHAPVAEVSGASAKLEAEIGNFLDALMQRPIGDEVQRAVVLARARLRLLRDLRESVAEFAAIATLLPMEAGPMIESLHLLLSELVDARDAEAQAWLIELAADRGEMMQQVRRRAVSVRQEEMFALTAIFERAVWLTRRFVLAEA